jgi:hypothetical protein
MRCSQLGFGGDRESAAFAPASMAHAESPVVSGYGIDSFTRARARYTAWELCRSESESALMCAGFTGIFGVLSSSKTLG